MKKIFYSLISSTYPKNKRDLVGIDYMGKLNEVEKAFLNKFNREFIEGNCSHENPLHNTQELKRDCYGRNNARNRDLLSIKKASGMVVDIDEYHQMSSCNDKSNNEQKMLESSQQSNSFDKIIPFRMMLKIAHKRMEIKRFKNVNPKDVFDVIDVNGKYLVLAKQALITREELNELIKKMNALIVTESP